MHRAFAGLCMLGLLSACGTTVIKGPNPGVDFQGPPSARLFLNDLTEHQGVQYLVFDERPPLNFELEFDEEMDDRTLKNSISIVDASGSEVAFNYTLQHATVTDEGSYYLYHPMRLSGTTTSPMKPNTAYTISINQQAKDRSGEALTAPISRAFRTTPDPYKLKVETVSLTSGDPPVLQVRITNQSNTIQNFVLYASCARNVIKTEFFRYLDELKAGDSREMTLHYNSGRQDLDSDTRCAYHASVLDELARVYVQ